MQRIITSLGIYKRYVRPTGPRYLSSRREQTNFRPSSGKIGTSLFAGALLYSLFQGDSAECHGYGDDHGSDKLRVRLEKLEKQVEKLTSVLEDQHDVKQTSGQGKAIFSWDKNLTDCFPKDAKRFEKDMHGGFNEDVETGIVYTGVPGYGLCAISPDLKEWKTIGTDSRLKSNIHGIVVFKHKGETNIALAQNDDQRVLIVSLKGDILQQLDSPKGGEFNFDEANAYYSEKNIKVIPWENPNVPSFACTDVTYLDNQLYVVTGYCPGDFVLTAHEEDGVWKWGPTAWGGKGTTPGKFNTAHGIFAFDDHIFVANREAHQVLEFTKTGQLVRCLPDIPESARICNVARTDDYFVMNALEPIQHTPAKTAAIYAHTGERLLSTIEPGDLGIPVLKHLHHVWPHYVTDDDGERTLYLLIHGWSRGKFAVLRHEPNGIPSQPSGWDFNTGTPL
eukprot:g9419.t1